MYYYIDPRSDLNHGLKELQMDEDMQGFYDFVYEYKLMKIYYDHLILEEIYELDRQKKEQMEELLRMSMVVIEEIEDVANVAPKKPARPRTGKMIVATLEWKHDCPI